MVVRLVRAGIGALLLLIAVPLVLAGGGLWLASGHRAADNTFAARLERVHTDGHALVVPDVDALLRADAPFARGGQTTLSLSARGNAGPLFIGLGPDRDVERYLDGLAQSRLTRVRLTRGPLPLDVTHLTGRPVQTGPDGSPDGVRPLPEPAGQPFWLAKSARSASADAELTWSPSALRGRHLALVIMNADGSADLNLALRASLDPAWLAPTTAGLLILGTALLLLAVLLLAWPQGRRAGRPALLPSQPAIEAAALPDSDGTDGRAMTAPPVDLKVDDDVEAAAEVVTEARTTGGEMPAVAVVGAEPPSNSVKNENAPSADAPNADAPNAEAPSEVTAVSVGPDELGPRPADPDPADADGERAIADEVGLPPLPPTGLQFTWPAIELPAREEQDTGSTKSKALQGQ